MVYPSENADIDETGNDMTTQTLSIPSPAPAYSAALAFGLSLALIALTPSVAYAVASPMGGVLCGIIEIVYGNLGRALATLAVISLGVGAMIGKVSWGLAITVATGIGVVFGAGPITKMFLSYALGGNQGIGCVVTGG